jgi:hypothetical protein
MMLADGAKVVEMPPAAIIESLKAELAEALAERNQADEAAKKLSDSLELARQALAGERLMRARAEGEVQRLTDAVKKAKPAPSHKAKPSMYDVCPSSDDIESIFKDIVNAGLLPANVPKTLSKAQMKELCRAIKDDWECPCDDELHDNLMGMVQTALEESFAPEKA